MVFANNDYQRPQPRCSDENKGRSPAGRRDPWRTARCRGDPGWWGSNTLTWLTAKQAMRLDNDCYNIHMRCHCRRLDRWCDCYSIHMYRWYPLDEIICVIAAGCTSKWWAEGRGLEWGRELHLALCGYNLNDESASVVQMWYHLGGGLIGVGRPLNMINVSLHTHTHVLETKWQQRQCYGCF